jgi:predicted acyltransferase
LLLFLLGIIYNGGLGVDSLSDIRVMGVLQRISLCYLFASLAFVHLSRRGQVGLGVGLLAGYWILMKWIPVPGHGPGVLTEQGNMARYVDGFIVPGRLYHDTWDPEGALSTLPAIVTCLLGVFAGQLLRSSLSDRRKLLALLAAGPALILAGLALHPLFPINKPLWSPSYVLLTGGISALLLAGFYGLIDVMGFKRWAFFFVVIGMNAITIYMVRHAIGVGSLLEGILVHARGDQALAFLGSAQELMINALDIAGCWLFLFLLYKKRWFLRV